jgi:hypothetical protein
MERQLAKLYEYNGAGPQDLSANMMRGAANGEHGGWFAGPFEVCCGAELQGAREGVLNGGNVRGFGVRRGHSALGKVK